MKVIKIDLSNCKNWDECQKIIESITSGKVKITVQELTKDSKRNTFRFNHFKKLFGNTCIN